MVWERCASALLVGACASIGCAPHGNPDSREEVARVEPEPPTPIEAAPAVPVEPKPADAPPQAPLDPPTPEVDTPPPAGQAVTPTVDIRFEDESEEGCLGIAGAGDVPAYDPTTGQVLTLETYEQKMSIAREADLVWYDARTGEELRREDLLADITARSCAKANRRARARAKALNAELRRGHWEAMTPVPIRRVHEDAYFNLRGGLAEDVAEDEDGDEYREMLADMTQSLMPRGQVHVVARNTGTVVRLPGVKVYERDVPIHPNTLAALVGHRPSGLVVATHADCRDEEDCTCNLEQRNTVMRWSPATLAAIDAHPCDLGEADDGDTFGCELGSSFDG